MSSEEAPSPSPVITSPLSRARFLRHVVHAMETNKFHLDEDKFNRLCRRVSQLDEHEFNEFIASVFEYLIKWEEKRNYEVLGMLVDLLDFVLGIVPAMVKSEIMAALFSISSWHVKLLVCCELFGEPEDNFEQKSDSSLPLELYLAFRAEETSPSDSLLNRIYSVEDNLIYKFCTIVLQRSFKMEGLEKFEIELSQLVERVKAFTSKNGNMSRVPRIRRTVSDVLNQAELQHGAESRIELS